MFYHLNPEYFAELNASRRTSNDDAITPDEITIEEPVDGTELGVDDL